MTSHYFAIGPLTFSWWPNYVSRWGWKRNRFGLFVDLGRLSVDWRTR